MFIVRLFDILGDIILGIFVIVLLFLLVLLVGQ